MNFRKKKIRDVWVRVVLSGQGRVVEVVLFVFLREGDTERERETQREGETERERGRETDRQREGERDRDRETQRETQRDREGGTSTF